MELAARGGRDSQGNYDVHRAAQLSDANDAWILQIAQNLTAANGAIVTLSGGAQAKYIFWQVAGQATLGTTSDFKGSILSKDTDFIQHRRRDYWRALAQTAVTLDATAVSHP
ncbi:MAG: ice-binding family protein [Gemmatimonadales bacterium]